MKCLVCGNLSFFVICKSCLDSMPFTPTSRTAQSGLQVYSFYPHSHIEYLLKTKYELIGSKILKILAQKCAEYFFAKILGDLQTANQRSRIQQFKRSVDSDIFHNFSNKIFAISVDDNLERFYSHTAIITRAFCKASKGVFIPQYSKLIATNRVNYAGKNLEYRLNNPRNFIYKGARGDAVLIDDIITTGLSLTQAHECLAKNGVNVLFALTLADARY
ncbi:ComF family protein [Helicobacter himalayensis]|uniref:ComF family protein n=1 Tax=Helicobacter himalayensis TaxID=1591088 RepID=UPI003D6F4EA5